MAKATWTDTQINTQLNSLYLWTGSNLTYGFPVDAIWFAYAEATGFSTLNTAQRTAATLAIKLWDDLMAPDFTQATNANTASIRFSNTTTNISYAHAYYPGGWNGAGSVWFSTNYGSGTGTNNLQQPVVGQWGWLTFIHEAGHAIGLNHAGNYNGGSPTYAVDAVYFQDSHMYSVMSYFRGDNTGADWYASNGQWYNPQTPMINDIMAIQAMYGVETTTRTGNTTYGFNSNADVWLFDFVQNPHPVLSIFDSAGIDTLDLSGWNTPSLIDLNPGTFSNANMMTYNISIARTTWIENGTGGGGNDVLIGNVLANTLTGNLGDDSFTGGAGNDTVQGGAGNDTAIYSGNFADYNISWNATLGAYVLLDTRAGTPNGTDTVKDVETFVFADGARTAASLLTVSTTSYSITPLAASALESAGQLTFTVTRSGDASAAGTVNWAATGAGVSPVNGADFVGGVLPFGTLSFGTGVTSQVITLNILNDTTVEANEGITVTLSAASGGAGIAAAGSAAGTVLNDDAAPPVISIAATDANKAEGDSGTTLFSFTITRTGDISAAGTVSWAVSSSTATGADFGNAILPSGTASFAANEASQVITVSVAGDGAVEANESFTVNLSAPSNGATLGTASATGTIVNDDSAYAIAALDANKAEGNSGGTPFTFTVSRTGNISGTGSVTWSVTGSGGVPAIATDFANGVLPGGTLTFAAGEASQIISVNVAGDSLVEGHENFTVNLSAPIGATPTGATVPVGNVPPTIPIVIPTIFRGLLLTRGGATPHGLVNRPPPAVFGSKNATPSGIVSLAASSAVGTIMNDDSVPAPVPATLSIAATDASKAEGNSGATAFIFTVTRSGDTSVAGTVNWQVLGSGASPTDGTDFSLGGLPGGSLSFALGEVSQIIAVNIAGDAIVEANEAFTVTLLNPSAGLTLGTASAVGTVLNDETNSYYVGTTGIDLFDASSSALNTVFDISQGGDDTTIGGNGGDTVILGAALTAADNINGGVGTDVVSLAGNYAAGLVLSATTLANVERINLGAGNSYKLTTNDATVGAGGSLTIDASALAAINSATINGAAELNGGFLFIGGAGNDTFTGGAGNDILRGGLGADLLTSGGGSDVFLYGSAADSPLTLASDQISVTGNDQLVNFAVTADRIDLSAFGFSGSSASLFTRSWNGFTSQVGTGLGFFGGAGAAIEYTRTGGRSARLYVDANRDGNLNSGDLLIQMPGVSKGGFTASNITF